MRLYCFISVQHTCSGVEFGHADLELVLPNNQFKIFVCTAKGLKCEDIQDFKILSCFSKVEFGSMELLFCGREVSKEILLQYFSICKGTSKKDGAGQTITADLQEVLTW